MTPQPVTFRTPECMNRPQHPTILAALAATVLFGCTRGAALSVVNRSTAELTSVVATGSRFTQSIDSIPAGAQRSVFLSVSGESDLGLDFDASGKHFTSEPQSYFEGGYNYKVTATVSPDFTVTVDAKR